MVCPNCENVYEGNYCNECGQKTIHGRYTFKGLFGELFFSAFHIEKKGLPYTIKELTIRPGIAIRKVLQGQRLTLYPAFKYLVLIGAVIIILSLRYRFFHSEELTSQGSGLYDNEFVMKYLPIVVENKDFFDGFFKYAEDKATIVNIIAIPIFAFFSWFFFRDFKYNYAESLVMNTFITSQQLLFLIILVPFIEFIPGSKHVLIPIYTLAIMLYNVFAYIQFYGHFTFSVVFRSLIAVITAFIYQLPVNMAIYYFFHTYVAPHIHWIPEINLP